GCEPPNRFAGRRVADARLAHERAQKVRPAGRAQTLPIQQAVIALEISRPRWLNPAGFFDFEPVVCSQQDAVGGAWTLIRSYVRRKEGQRTCWDAGAFESCGELKSALRRHD